jgi:hypothetical protein
MSRRSRAPQSAADAGTAIFGDELAAELASRLDVLAQQVLALEDQVRSQFTSVATYAAIASEQVEFARNEAHADVERTRELLIGLMEQLRNEVYHAGTRAVAAPGSRTLPTPVAVASDQGRVLERLDDVERGLEICFERQRELAETVAAVFDTITAGAGDQPIADLALI